MVCTNGVDFGEDCRATECICKILNVWNGVMVWNSRVVLWTGNPHKDANLQVSFRVLCVAVKPNCEMIV